MCSGFLANNTMLIWQVPVGYPKLRQAETPRGPRFDFITSAKQMQKRQMLRDSIWVWHQTAAVFIVVAGYECICVGYNLQHGLSMLLTNIQILNSKQTVLDTKWAGVKLIFAKNAYCRAKPGSLLQPFRCIEVHRQSLRCLSQNTYHGHHMFGRQQAHGEEFQQLNFDWRVSSKRVHQHIIFE